MKCPNCEFDSPAEMRFCGMCGAPLTRTCRECNFVNPVTYRFCGNCGASLSQEDSALTRSNRSGNNSRYLAMTQASAKPQLSPSLSDMQAANPVKVAPHLPVSAPTLPQDAVRRVATILFADVKGSTELLEILGTEAWVDLMNNIFQVLEVEIYRYGGEVGQFRGDGLVAYFGARSANEDDPEHAVMAGLSMLSVLRPIAEDLARKEKIELALRVGINTGEIIVGNVGDSRQYSEDTAMGEALTVASRMETAAEPGTVLVSENTYRLAQTHFEWKALGSQMVKGIGHGILVYRPLAAKVSSESASDSALGQNFAHGLIARQQEYRTLKGIVEDLDNGRGGIVLVTGVKGMGKSFLVNQVRQNFVRQNVLWAAAAQSVQEKEGSLSETPASPSAEHQTITWLHGRCRSYGHLRPYSMWFDLIQGWLNENPDAQQAEAQAVLRAQIEAQLGSDIEQDYPNLAPFMSIPVDETALERARHLDAETLKRQFFETFRRLIESLSQQRPLVVSFADMQWADPTSLELLDYCLPLCDTNAVLWLLVYRPDRDSPVWEFEHRLETQYPHRITRLPMPPFSGEDSNLFLDQFVGTNVLFPETRALILKKAEGNPYYIKELIFALIAQGALIQESDRTWRQTRAVTSLDLPDSLQSLLMARLDRLSVSERKVVQMAAVVGSVFWTNALQALSGPSVTPAQLQADLVSLQRAGLIHERANVPDMGMEYAFDSSLVREVAYESLLSTQRTSYHLRVAEYLEEIVYRDGRQSYYDSLAHHYKLAGDVKKELFYTLQAAERAHSIYANTEALRYYTRALDLLDQIDQQSSNGHQRYAVLTQKFEALNGRRAIHFLMGSVDAGVADARALLDLARKMDDDPTWLIDALLQQPGVSGVTSLNNRSEVENSLPQAMEALGLARQIGDRRRELDCLLAIASQRNLLNDPTWVEIGDQALALARDIGDRQYEAIILLSLGHNFVGRDELSKGMEYLNQALPICQELDNRVIELMLLRVMGAQYERSGDHYKRLVEFEQKRLAIAHQIGHRFEEASSLMFCGQIEGLNLGDLTAGQALLEQALEIYTSTDAGMLFPLLRIAQIQINLGHYEEAQETLNRARPVSENNVYELGRVGWLMVSVILDNALGDEKHLRNALDVIERINCMDEHLMISRQYRMAAACEATAAHLSLARLLTHEDERQEELRLALENSRIAVDIYSSFGYVNIVECACEEVYFRHSQALTANGMSTEANEYLEMAYEEMMRKFELIPPESPYRRTYLENLAYHREIRAAVAALKLLPS